MADIVLDPIELYRFTSLRVEGKKEMVRKTSLRTGALWRFLKVCRQREDWRVLSW
jgi:hypothetical protein